MNNTIIRFENVSKSYDDGTVVLKNINFELKKVNSIPYLVHQVVVKRPFYELLQVLQSLLVEMFILMEKKSIMFLRMNGK